MALIANVDTDNAFVALFVDFSPVAGTHTTATVVRILPDGTETFVQGATQDELLLLGEQGYLWDTAAPLDVAVTYRATSDTGDTMTAGPVTVPSNGFVWFKDPNRPWANVRVDLCIDPTPQQCGAELVDDVALVAFGPEARAADAGLFPILNRELPVDVFARRKGVVTSARFVSRTLEAVDKIYVLFTAGGPLFIQAPAVYGWPDRYVQPGDLGMDRISPDQRRPWRLWEVPLTVIDQPVGLPQGVIDATWCDLEEDYATWADFNAANPGATWGDVVSGETTGGATPPPADGYGGGGFGEGPYGD